MKEEESEYSVGNSSVESVESLYRILPLCDISLMRLSVLVRSGANHTQCHHLGVEAGLFMCAAHHLPCLCTRLALAAHFAHHVVGQTLVEQGSRLVVPLLPFPLCLLLAVSERESFSLVTLARLRARLLSCPVAIDASSFRVNLTAHLPCQVVIVIEHHAAL